MNNEIPNDETIIVNLNETVSKVINELIETGDLPETSVYEPIFDDSSETRNVCILYSLEFLDKARIILDYERRYDFEIFKTYFSTYRKLPMFYNVGDRSELYHFETYLKNSLCMIYDYPDHNKFNKYKAILEN